MFTVQDNSVVQEFAHVSSSKFRLPRLLQVAIKIIDKTQLNPTSLQKVSFLLCISELLLQRCVPCFQEQGKKTQAALSDVVPLRCFML